MSQQNYRESIWLEHDTKQGHFLTPAQRKHLTESLVPNLRPEYHLRIKIMLLADSGQPQAQICQVLGCSRETARYWIAMVQAGEVHKWQDQLRGRPKIVTEQYLTRLWFLRILWRDLKATAGNRSSNWQSVDFVTSSHDTQSR